MIESVKYFTGWHDKLCAISDILDNNHIQDLNDFFAFNNSAIDDDERKNTAGDFQDTLQVILKSLKSLPGKNFNNHDYAFNFLLDEYLNIICTLLVKFNYSTSFEDEHIHVLKRVMKSLADILYDLIVKNELYSQGWIRSKLNFIFREKEKIESLHKSMLSSLINDSVVSHSKRVETKVNSIRSDATHQFNNMMNENLQVILKVEENANILRTLENRVKNILDKADWLPDAANEVINKAESRLDILDKIEASCRSKEESIDSSFRISNSYSMGRAFKERGDSLKWSIVIWAVSFFCSLISIPALILFICDFDISQLSTDYKASLARSFMIIPSIWMAWFSAKQYAHSSKLKEDYEYKLAMAKAYEAYKQEAASHSDDMMGMLLKNSLDKITENPVRLYSTQENNTPITEILSRFTPEQLMEVLKVISTRQSTK
ncbi:hypothetical protein [Aeromonas taiwanensis]|uniref:hypothetical protein n=1 Tax=Aeromonas taiwanensis TaxID=633417 RepID=UPI003BA02860